MGDESNLHIPVLLKETLEFWAHKPDGVYVDLTLGMGGHTEALLQKFPNARVVGVDWDTESLEHAKERLKAFEGRVTFVHKDFARAAAAMKDLNIKADGILFDLGFSSFQMLHAGRGFSYQKDEPLDMRLSTTLSAYPASAYLARAGEDELAEIFRSLGEIPLPVARRIAREIGRVRAREEITTSGAFAKIVGKVSYDRGVLARAFQALRITINGEIRQLDELLSSVWTFCSPGARVVAISFHSLEDRKVKEVFKARAASGEIEILTPKPLTASEEEIQQNPKSRSAKLRAAQVI